MTSGGLSVFCGTQITAVPHLQSCWLYAAPTHIWMCFVYPPFPSRICIGHYLYTRSCVKCWRYQPEYKLVLDLKKSAALHLRKLTKSLYIALAEDHFRDGSGCTCGNVHTDLTPLEEEVGGGQWGPLCVLSRTS